MVTPTGLMRWELICDSDGATFVKSDSQLQQPGRRDNSLPVRLCVHRSECVCTCTRVRLWARAHTAVCVCEHISARSTQERISGSYSHLFALYLHSVDINFRMEPQRRAQVVSVINLGIIPKWQQIKSCSISGVCNNEECGVHNVSDVCFALKIMCGICLNRSKIEKRIPCSLHGRKKDKCSLQELAYKAMFLYNSTCIEP